MVREQIANDLARICQKLGLSSQKIEITHAPDQRFGDYSTNLPLQQQKQDMDKGWQYPEQIAKKIVAALGKPDYLEKTEVISPGFINFFLSKNFLQSQVGQILEKRQSFSTLDIGKGKKARIEFVSANPTGPLHIGNARGGPLGDTIANILESAGFQVFREFYLNDRGEQVRKFGESLFKVVSGVSLGQLEYKGEYVKEIAEEVKKDIEKQFGTNYLKSCDKNKLITLFTKIGLKRIEKEIIGDCEAMGINYDWIYRESNFAHKPKGLPSQTETVISRLRSVIKEKDGALWFAPNDEFLKDRESVLIKSNGELTYFANDIGYHVEKFEDEKFGKPDLVIDVLGSTHHGHIPRLQAAIAALGFNVSKLKFILYQFVRVKRGTEIIKMSKRAGNIITAREVLDEVGKDAFRFFMLMHAPSTHMDFDLEQATKQASDNPVYYVQYAHARICSILKKAKTFAEADLTLLNHQAELALIKQLIKLPEILADISENFQVQILPNYALGTATSFHKFYEQCRVISDDKELTAARLGLLRATRIILGQSLKLLGVGAPEKMSRANIDQPADPPKLQHEA